MTRSGSGAGLARRAGGVRRHGQRGFSLLEVLVAFAIAAMALGLIYEVMGNDARQAGGLAERERALALAQSLLDAYALVPQQDVHDSGDSAGYAWRIDSAPYPTDVGNASPQAPRLHELRATVSWGERGQGNLELHTLRPERPPQPGNPGATP